MRGQYYTQQPLSRNAGGLLFWLGELTIPKECYYKFCWQGIVGFLQNVTLFAYDDHIQYVVCWPYK